MLAQEADINYATKHSYFKTFCKEKLLNLFLLFFITYYMCLQKTENVP